MKENFSRRRMSRICKENFDESRINTSLKRQGAE